MTSLSQAEKLRRAYVDWVAGTTADYSIGLSVNRNVTVDKFRDLIRQFMGRVDRSYLGTVYHTYPAAARTNGVFFVEHCASNIHAHGFLKFPSSKTLQEIDDLCRGAWSGVCASGTHDVQEVYGGTRGIWYATKEMERFNYDAIKQVILVRELMGENSL